jgi:zeaxanthin glucosyltransferase
MHLALVCPEMTGHLNPSLALGRALARRGHRVTVFSTPGARPKAERAGLEHAAVAEKEHADGGTAAALERLGRMRGMAATMYTGRLTRIGQDLYLRDLPDAFRRARIDGVVTDQVSPAGAVVAERMDLPYVVVCNALAMCYDPTVPPPVLLWRYRTGPLARLRNRLATTCLLPLFNRIAGVGPEGVSPLLLFFECHRGLAVLAQQPSFFDFPRAALPDHFHYTGPWHEPSRDDDLRFPWDHLDERPLVYASLGTLQNRLHHVYAAIVDAVRGLDVQLVLALGSPTATLDVTPPENVLVVPFAPQIRLLERASAAITHAGLNTALECLAQVVPMLCLPVTNDQPGVARRVEWISAGEVLPVRRATAARIRTLLTRILGDRKYREAAQHSRDAIAATDGASLAARIIEQAISGRKPVLRADETPTASTLPTAAPQAPPAIAAR